MCKQKDSAKHSALENYANGKQALQGEKECQETHLIMLL